MRSFERAPSAATASRVRIAPRSESESSATCLPGRQRATEAARRATPSRRQRSDKARTMSSLKAIWASGSASFLGSKWRWGRRTASRTSPSMMSIARIGLRFRFDRLPGADALEEPPRPLGDRDCPQRWLCALPGRRRRRIDERDGSAAAPMACFRAAASDKPATPPPAMATSKTGKALVKARGSPEARIVGRLRVPRN